MPRSTVELVVTDTAIEVIIAPFTVQFIDAFTTKQLIVTTTTEDMVITFFTVDLIVPLISTIYENIVAVEVVVTFAPMNHIIAGLASYPIVMSARFDHIGAPVIDDADKECRVAIESRGKGEVARISAQSEIECRRRARDNGIRHFRSPGAIVRKTMGRGYVNGTSIVAIGR